MDILISLLMNVLGNDLYDRAPRLAVWLIRKAVVRLPMKMQPGYEEAWLSHLADCETKLDQIRHAIGVYWSVQGVIRAEPKSLSAQKNSRSPASDAIPIRDLPVTLASHYCVEIGDVPVTFSPHGGAVPGDRIVGILTPGAGVTIYPIQSAALTAFDNEPERWLDCHWVTELSLGERFLARLVLKSINEPGVLAQILQEIADYDGNIENISMNHRKHDFIDFTLDLSVWDLQHLRTIIVGLRGNPLVSRVERVNG